MDTFTGDDITFKGRVKLVGPFRIGAEPVRHSVRDQEHSPKNLIIFGAGASFGSVDVKPSPPPIGSELFGAFEESFPSTWGQIPDDLKELFEDDFENGMVELDKSSPQDMTRRLKDMATFFFKFSLGANNRYLKLADRIKASNWDGALVTLNYDRLLMRALSKAGVPANQPGSTPVEDALEVCMPHGCCNIFCKSFQIDPPNDLIGVLATGNPEIVDDQEEFDRRIKRNAVPPVMSYYNADKTTMACAETIEDQRFRYSELVGNAEKISIVGIGPNFHDSHIWNPLADSDAILTICAGPDASKFKSWVTDHKPDSVLLDGRFADEFESLMAAVELKKFATRRNRRA